MSEALRERKAVIAWLEAKANDKDYWSAKARRAFQFAAVAIKLGEHQQEA